MRPTTILIPNDHVEGMDGGNHKFLADQHYFQIRVNDLYLPTSREWLNTYDPLVLFVSEFTYDREVESVPFVVGPNLLENIGQDLPTGMTLRNTRVAGIYPYRGGRLNLSLVLCRVERMNYARTMLELIEGAAGALDFSQTVSNYLKVSKVILDGVEALLGIGDTQPLIGSRFEMDPDAGDRVEQGYRALINVPESKIDMSQFWVRDNRLMYGPSLSESTLFDKAEYVLFSVVKTAKRDDTRMLPFYPLFRQIIEASARPDEESWKRAKANMVTLFQTMILSPDLTHSHAISLKDHYVSQMKNTREQALSLHSLGTSGIAREAMGAGNSEFDNELSKLMNNLNFD